MGGLFFLALYYFGTRDRATFFFSIFCILYSYRLVGTSYYSLHTVFPDLNWFVTIRIEYISLFGGVYLFFKYVKNLYPNDVHKAVLYAVSTTCLSLCIITLVTPVYFFTKLLTPFLLLLFLYILYVIAVLVKAYRNKRPAAGFALISVAVLMVMQLMVELDYFGIINSSRWALFGGHIIFFFLQSLILSFRFSFRLKLAKKQAERGLKAKSDFLSTMSHEIRTPLNSVIGMSNLMLQNSPRPDQKEQLDVLQFSANSLLCIVNDILDYNKIEAGKISFEQVEMDIKGIIIKILSGLRMQAKEKGIYLQYEGDEALDCQVMGDPTRFAQVVQNLVGNAVKFTTQGGVTVTVGVISKGQSTVTVKVSVIDTGIGIAKQNQQLIFERFTQEDSTTSRKYGGTGLGLAICKKILLLQNSDLLIKSEPGKGATFYFTQVFKKGKALAIANESAPVAEPAKQKPLLGTLILLVEDNNVNIMVARNFLEGWGAGIEVAHNGQEAIDMLDVARHQLVLMDLHMPVMDGYTAIRKIREQGIGIPIIALTASLPSEVDAEMKGLAINGYVLKPFVPEDLLKKVMSHTVSAET
jgi:signal transduction histidine kinase/CheY-like chemotaxis protein